MNLADHPYAQKWLKQFDDYSANIAKTYLRSLILIPFAEFEHSISKLLVTLSDNNKSRVAAFSINKPSTKVANYKNKRAQGTSADRVNHLLTNLERHHPKKIYNSPTIESMRKEKVKHIVYVDDIIGSGSRFCKHWKEHVSKSIKSWISYKKIQVWIVTYVAHQLGIQNIINNISAIKIDSINYNLLLPENHIIYDGKYTKLFSMYGSQTSKPNASLGYGDVMSYIIFQHGCPNNVPAFLWSNGQAWKALFPNRAIPSEIYECFEVTDNSINAEILWGKKQYDLALKLLDLIEEGSQINKTHLITVLGLVSRGCSLENLHIALTLSNIELKALLKHCKEFELIDGDGRITGFGRDILNRIRKRIKGSDKFNRAKEEEINYYYPAQYWGLQQKSSQFSDFASRNQ